MFYSPTARQIVASAPKGRVAAAGALTTTTRGTAQTLGATIVAGLLAAGIGNGPSAPLIAAGLVAIAGICSASAFRRKTGQVEFEDLPEF